MARTIKYPMHKYVLAAVDALIIFAGYVFAFYIERRWLAENIPLSTELLLMEGAFFVIIAVLCIAVFHYLDLYKINVFVTVVNHLVRIVKGLGIVLIGIAVISFFTKAYFIIDSRLWILYFFLSSIALFAIGRVWLFRQVYLYLSRSKILQRTVLIVGAKEHGKNVAVNLFLHDYLGLRVVGFLDDDIREGTPIFNAAKVIGTLHEIEACVRQYKVKEIIICLEQIEHTVLMNLMEETMHLNVIVKISSPLYEIVPLRRAIEHYGNVPVLGVFQSGMSEKHEFSKRAFDFVLASLMMLLLAPVFAVIMVLIKSTSHGPVFFRQVRIGKDGKPFKIFKFRSMTVGADDDEARKKQMQAFIRTKRQGPPVATSSTKIVNEARITAVGKWLRNLSLDELPQLINVLRGEMSLVGPRPCLPYEWEHYEEWHKRRLSVLPGLTGMWQVAGRSIVGFEDMVILDLHYIQNASLVLDFRVLLKTIPVMLFGTGAK